MYKIIACDLDETLLGSDRKVSVGNRAAIAKARERGVKFVLATGRGFASVQGTLTELGLNDADGEYVISFNGGVITENKQNRVLSFHGLPFDLAQDLFARGLARDVCIHVYTIDTVYAFRLNDNEVSYVNGRMEMTESHATDLNFLAGQNIVKILFQNTDAAYLRQIEADCGDIADRADISFSSNRYIEFNAKGVTKGAGLLQLCSVLDVNPQDTVAIGDNFNDLPMIQAAGLGVGVQNSAEGLKKFCDVVTEARYDEDAVAEVIEKYILT